VNRRKETNNLISPTSSTDDIRLSCKRHWVSNGRETRNERRKEALSKQKAVQGGKGGGGTGTGGRAAGRAAWVA